MLNIWRGTVLPVRYIIYNPEQILPFRTSLALHSEIRFPHFHPRITMRLGGIASHLKKVSFRQKLTKSKKSANFRPYFSLGKKSKHVGSVYQPERDQTRPQL